MICCMSPQLCLPPSRHHAHQAAAPRPAAARPLGLPGVPAGAAAKPFRAAHAKPVKPALPQARGTAAQRLSHALRDTPMLDAGAPGDDANSCFCLASDLWTHEDVNGSADRKMGRG